MQHGNSTTTAQTRAALAAAALPNPTCGGTDAYRWEIKGREDDKPCGVCGELIQFGTYQVCVIYRSAAWRNTDAETMRGDNAWRHVCCLDWLDLHEFSGPTGTAACHGEHKEPSWKLRFERAIATPTFQLELNEMLVTRLTHPDAAKTAYSKALLHAAQLLAIGEHVRAQPARSLLNVSAADPTDDEVEAEIARILAEIDAVSV